MTGRGKWSPGRVFVFISKTEEIIIYANGKDPGKFDTGDKEENYQNEITEWRRLDRI